MTLLQVTMSSACILPASALSQCNDMVFLDGLEEPGYYDWAVAVTVGQLGDDDPERNLTLTLNGADPLMITADGTYCFNDTTPGAQTYTIQITEQPVTGNVCSLDNNPGVANGPVLVNAVCDTPPTLWDLFDWNGADWN